MGKKGCCGGSGEGCACENESHEKHAHEGHDHAHDHGHDHANPNPFANLDEETQIQIQEIQILEQNFQQLMMQKNAFSGELQETEYVISEVSKTSGEVSRIISGQVLIKSSKDEVLKTMKEKKKVLESRIKSVDDKEKDFTKRINELREEILKKIQK